MDILDTFLEVGSYGDCVTPALSLARQALGQTQPVAVPLDYMVDVEFVMKQNGFKMLYPTIYQADQIFAFDVPKAHWPHVRSLLGREFGFEWP